METKNQESLPGVNPEANGLKTRINLLRRTFLPTQTERLTNTETRRDRMDFAGKMVPYSYHIQRVSDGSYSPTLLGLARNEGVKGVFFKDGALIYAGHAEAAPFMGNVADVSHDLLIHKKGDEDVFKTGAAALTLIQNEKIYARLTSFDTSSDKQIDRFVKYLTRTFKGREMQLDIFYMGHDRERFVGSAGEYTKAKSK